MDHLSKFHLNQTVNEPENVVLQKLRKLKKWVAPSAQQSGALRLAVQSSRRVVPVLRKYEKQHFS